MKNYKEMAQSVFDRRDQYNAEMKMIIHKMKKSVISVAGCCFLAVLSIVVWHSNAGSSTFSPTNADIPHNTTDTTMETNIGNEGETDTIIWLSADEVLRSAENDIQYMGVAVPMLVAYEGAIYGLFTEEFNENSQYALLENEITLRKNYSYPAYQVKDFSNGVAIVINGILTTYQKLFELTAVIDGNSYRIVQPMMSGIDYSYGEIIQENEDFTIYQAINAQSGEVMEAEYVINILKLLKRKLPTFFAGDENYGDAWWVAVPQSNG